MENSNPEFVTIITDKEQILEAYPDDFETIPLDRAYVHLEKLDADSAKYEERIILTINGALAISTYDLDSLWTLSLKDYSTLNAFLEYASTQRLMRKEARGFPTMAVKEINGTSFAIKYFPYQEPVSDAKLLDMLNRRVK